MQPSDDGTGLGLDIVGIDRMERVLQRTPSLRMRVFTEGERGYCDATARPAVHYATRFAAKQAVLKSMGAHIFSGVALRDVEIVRPPHSRPVARLHGRALQLAKRLGVVEVPVSLSFTHDEAVAFAMAITSDSVPSAPAEKDPVKELSAQFKEARAILDDLPTRKVGDGAAGAAVRDSDETRGLHPVQAWAEGHAKDRGSTQDAPAALEGLDAQGRPDSLPGF